MANQEHLDILLQGVEVWNTWRDNLRQREEDFEFSTVELDLNYANLAGMNLVGANLSWAHLWGANLKGANLKGARLSYANFGEADLSDTDLSGAHLSYANFANMKLPGTNISHAIMYATIFSNVDLSQAKGLETVDHLGSSSIYLDTILKSHGRIPEAFLRGAQGHYTFYECFIEYNRLLTGQSTNYPPCFLVYAPKDEELARRLARDLQMAGIRCWLDTKDVSPGRFLSSGVVSPVQFYDRVVLLLSGEPEYEKWADDDVRAVLEQEEREGQHVLFPIFRDVKVLMSAHPWTAYLRETRELGDFRQWQNEAKYQQAFSQLLHNLTREKLEETKPFLIDYALLEVLKEQRDLQIVPNQEHLAILLQGVEVWNAWQKERELGLEEYETIDLEPDLKRADLSGMALEGINFDKAHLWRARMQGAHLKGASLKYADFDEADLSDADLSETNLGSTNFSNTNLRNTNVSHAVMSATVFMDIDLSQVQGLETVDHLESSSIYLNTILKSHGRIPEAFLRGAQGHSTFYESFIKYNRLLTGESIDYPPCFLVYAPKDEELARRLARDLQVAGIRCWFDADKVSPGQFLSGVSPVRFYDKVVLLLSGEPEYNDWADDDIRAALEQEERDDQKVLFPLFRDTKILTSDQPWTAYLRETRDLGDFRQWQNEAKYQQAFSQLLYDLKAEE